jgi:hypothetical protein
LVAAFSKCIEADFDSEVLEAAPMKAELAGSGLLRLVLQALIAKSLP